MSKDQTLGAVILVGSLLALLIYGYLLYAGHALLVYGIVITFLVIAVVGIVAWIGWTMATTPSPAPIESLDDVQATSSETAENSS